MLHIRHTMLKVVETVQQDLNSSLLLLQIPHKQHSTDVLHFPLSFFPDREPPTRPASCGTKMKGEFCGFLFTLMGLCAFGVNSSQF